MTQPNQPELMLSDAEREQIIQARNEAAQRAATALNEMVFEAVQREIDADMDRLCNEFNTTSEHDMRLLLTENIQDKSREDLLEILLVTRSQMLRNDFANQECPDNVNNYKLPFEAPGFYDQRLTGRYNEIHARQFNLTRLMRGERRC
jgi:hypothetical protein